MLKWVKYIAAAVTVAFSALLYLGWASDIPHDTLAEKYAVGASDFIELPSGATAHYRMQGNEDGTTLLLLHGSNASLHTWEGWVEELEADHMVITVDLPGHGLTGRTPANNYTYGGMVTFLKEFADTLGLDSFYLGGNSMGGGVTLQYALTYPKDLRGIILVDSAGIDIPARAQHTVDRPLAFNLAGHWYSSWILNNVTPRSFVIEGLKKSITDHALITDAMIDRYWDLVRHPGNREATNARFSWYREGRAELPVAEITLPTLIIWGADDTLIPVDVAHELTKRIKGSQLAIFQGNGHIPMEENPIATAASAQSFMATLHTNSK